MADDREAFEMWVTAPPYERSTARLPEPSAGPGQYRDINVQLAWEAWQASAKRFFGQTDWSCSWQH